MPHGFYSTNSDVFPQQMVPLKEKLAKGKDDQKSWKESCMDALETIGKNQYQSNLKLIENYEMIKGRFIFNHYFETEGNSTMLSQLTAEFELPKYLRHYDIISQVTNTLSGEWQKRPDLFKARQLGDGAANEYLRTKTDLTQKYVFGKINAEINKRLLDQGIDPNKQDFESQEEAQQYGEQLQQIRQEMTPLEIQKYMDSDFLTQAEVWGQHQLKYDKEVYNQIEKEKTEFEDMLSADRCFRHFYITPTGCDQETWNPVIVFFHKSPEVTYIEDGDYVGRSFPFSINSILDRYGYLMNKEDFELLNGRDKKDDKKWSDHKYNWVYDNYLVPFNAYPTYDLMKDSWNKPGGSQSGNIPYLDDNFYNSSNRNNIFSERDGFYFVTEAYWKTQKKIIKITYIDEQLEEKVVRIVDENYVLPDYFVESDSIFSDDQDINTYVETWITEVWKGIKINTKADKSLKKDLYLAIGPNDFQFKGDNNIYGCKLPVCGQVFSVRNSRSMSLVDMMKPHQIGYNVAMNQLYQLAEKEVGMFMIMDVNMFPNSKDWGGEDSWGKWMLIAKSLGILPADTSPQNIKSSLAATGGYLPKIMDLNLAGQMVSRMNMATFYEQQALKQVGFNQYRLGSFAQTSTATGIEQGMAQSYVQTESYFINFSNYLRRCHQMSLGIAQFVQSQKEDVAFTYVKSDMSRAFIKILGIDLLLADIGVRVSNSQEHARQLEMIRQFALQNNTSGMSPVDVSDVIMMNSPAEIRRQLSISYEKLMKQQQQGQELEVKKLEQEKELRILELDQEDLENEKNRENKLDVAKISAGASVINSKTDDESDQGESKQAQLDLSRKANEDGNSIKRETLELAKNRTRAEIEFKNKKLALDQAKINASLQIQSQETETARILVRDKEEKKKPTKKSK